MSDLVMTKAEIHLTDRTVLRGMVHCGAADRFDNRLSDVMNADAGFLPLIAAEILPQHLQLSYVCINKRAISYVIELETQVVPEGGWPGE